MNPPMFRSTILRRSAAVKRPAGGIRRSLQSSSSSSSASPAAPATTESSLLTPVNPIQRTMSPKPIITSSLSTTTSPTLSSEATSEDRYYQEEDYDEHEIHMSLAEVSNRCMETNYIFCVDDDLENERPMTTSTDEQDLTVAY